MGPLSLSQGSLRKRREAEGEGDGTPRGNISLKWRKAFLLNVRYGCKRGQGPRGETQIGRSENINRGGGTHPDDRGIVKVTSIGAARAMRRVSNRLRRNER